MLIQHPQIVIHPTNRRKELHYFDNFFLADFGNSDISTYHKLFPRPPGSASGEWTPGYIYDTCALPLLASAAPQAKLLVILRDPIERYKSHVAFMSRLGAPPRAVLMEDALRRGLYFEQLARIGEFFPYDQVLILQYEKCLKDPERELQRTYSFIGLSPVNFAPEGIRRSVDTRGGSVMSLPSHVKRIVKNAYREDADKLTEAFPQIDLSLWCSLTE